MNAISSYFAAERAEGLFFFAVGVVALGFALWFWFGLRRPFFNGMAWPLAGVAVLQIVVGASVFVRSPHDSERVQQFVRAEPQRIGSDEIPRMQTVMKNFIVYRWIEIGPIALGALLLLAAAAGSFWRGAGLGLLLQAGLMLALDAFAERRGADYLVYLGGL